jgi:hypothetical protein
MLVTNSDMPSRSDMPTPPSRFTNEEKLRGGADGAPGVRASPSSVVASRSRVEPAVAAVDGEAGEGEEEGELGGVSLGWGGETAGETAEVEGRR